MMKSKIITYYDHLYRTFMRLVIRNSVSKKYSHNKASDQNAHPHKSIKIKDFDMYGTG